MRCFGRSRSQEDPVPAPAEPTSGEEARQAVEDATARLTESYQRWPQVRRAARRLDETREFDHFSDKIAEAYRSQH